MRPFALKAIVLAVAAAAGGSLLNRLNLPTAAAYSLRRLSDSYSGPACRVRRSSDSLEADIGFLGNGSLDVYALMNHVGAENLLPYSEDFNAEATGAPWVKQAGVTVVNNSVIGPTGHMTGATLTWGAADTESGIYTYIPALGVTATKSIWVRADVPGGTVKLVDPIITLGEQVLVLSTQWQAVTLTEAAPPPPNGVGIWLRKQADSPATIYIADAQINRGSVALDYFSTAGTPSTSGQNLLLNSEGGVASLDLTSGVTDAGTSIADYQSSLQFGSETGYAYRSAVCKAGETYSFGAVVQMDDDSVPVFDDLSSNSYGSIVMGGVAVPAVVSSLGGNRYLVSASATVSGSSLNWGVAKYSTNSPKSFRVTGYQLNEGLSLLPYSVTTVTALDSGSGYVTKIYDQSGHALNLVQNTAANQPRLVFAGTVDRIGSATKRPVFRTDGINQFLASGSLVLAQPFTRSSVLQFLNPANANQAYLESSTGVSPSAQLGPIWASTLGMYAGTYVQLATGIATNDSATVVETFNGVSSVGSYNGTPTSGNAGINGINGVLAGSNQASAYGTALYGELLVFTVALSTADRQTLELNQRTYWGTP